MHFYILRRLLRRHAQLTREDAQARRAIRMLSAYLAVFALHIAAMTVFEDMSLGNVAWLTATAVTTMGYGAPATSACPRRFLPWRTAKSTDVRARRSA